MAEDILKNQPKPKPRVYKGVAGWLLFLCISFAILNPLVLLFAATFAYVQFMKIAPAFPRVGPIMLVRTILAAIMGVWTIYAGVSLWRVRPGAVRIAKSYLIAMLFYAALISASPFCMGLPASLNDRLLLETSIGVFQTLCYFTIWFLYLCKSQRVRNTYGAAEGPEPVLEPAA